MNGKSDWLKTLGFNVSDEDMDLDIEGYLQRNIDTFSKHMDEILAKANIEPTSDQARNLKLYVQEWQTLNAELASVDSGYIDEYLQKIPQLVSGYDTLTNSQKSFISEYIRNGFNAYDLENNAVKVKSSIVDMVEGVSSDEKVKSAINSLFALDAKDLNVTDYVNQYKEILDNVISQLNISDADANSLRLKLSVDADDLATKYENAIKTATTKFDGNNPTKFFKDNSINTQEEIDAWLEVAQAAGSAAEAERLYLEQGEREEKSLSQKVNKEIRNGEEVYVEDYDAVRKAKEDKIDAQFNIDKYNLEQQITDAKTALDDLNDGYQKQIEALEEISKKYSEISTAAEKISNANLATSLFGENWADKILSGNDEEIYATLTSLYQTNAKQLEEYQKQASSTDNISSLLENYIDSYKNGTITYEQAMTKINGLLSQMNESMTAMDNLQNIYDYLGTVNGTDANSDSILKGIKDGLSVTADELAKSLEQYNKNAGTISEYTSSWQQLTDNVKSMLDVLKQVRDNLRNALDDYDSGDDDEPYDKSRGKGWGTGDVNNGPGVYADGIKNGLVGSSSDTEREKMIKYLSTNELKEGEVPIIAHEGEAILNSDQQEQLLDNVDTSPRLDNVDTPPSSDIEAVFNKLGLKKLDPGEHPMILHNKEVIFPEEQQKALMDKFAELNILRPNINVPDYSKLITKQTQPIDIDINFGDWTFPQTDNVDEKIDHAFDQYFTAMNMAIMQGKSKLKDRIEHGW